MWNFSFLTSHLAKGTTLGMEALAGSGLHHLGGTQEEVYARYDLLDGSMEILDGPREETDLVYEGSSQWQIHWNMSFGDPQNQMELQRWDATDWVRIGPGSQVGDPLDVPPDYEPS